MTIGMRRLRGHTSGPRLISADHAKGAPPVPDSDATMVLGIASTAMPFARSLDAEAERWLRILRLYGDAGSALQALGVSEAPLEDLGVAAESGQSEAQRLDGRDVVAAVSEQAAHAARRRRAQSVETSDVLVAVMQVYGPDFERVLWAHGTDCGEVLERLGESIPESAPSG